MLPDSNVNNLKSSIDHHVQLVAYNKNLIKQYGTCYLKVRSSNNRVHICKFYVADSHFNLIIGVGSCLKLGLITFQSPVYTGWNDGKLVSIGVNAADQNTKETTKDNDAKKCGLNANPMGECTTTQQHDTIPNVLTKDWIVNHPKYKHPFSGIGRFKCAPVSVEMRPEAEPVLKAARRVPLALKDKFSKEIQSTEEAGILTKLTPEMPTPQWLNSFVVVKKPNGNLCVYLDLTNLNKSIIRLVCNMRTLEEIIDLLKDSLTLQYLILPSHSSMFPLMRHPDN